MPSSAPAGETFTGGRLAYVGPDETPDPSRLAAGLAGRAKRDRDGRQLRVLHVEDKRHRGGAGSSRR